MVNQSELADAAPEALLPTASVSLAGETNLQPGTALAPRPKRTWSTAAQYGAAHR